MKNKILSICILTISTQLFPQAQLDYVWHTKAPCTVSIPATHPLHLKEIIVDDTLFIFSRFIGDSLDADPTALEDWIDDESSTFSTVYYLTKLSLNGTYLGSKKLVESPEVNVFATDFTISQDGRIIVIGICDSLVDFDPSSSAVSSNSPTGHSTYISFYNSQGEYISKIEYPRTISNLVNFEKSTIDQDNQLYLGGYAIGTNDYDFTSGIDLITSIGGTDVAMIAIDLNTMQYKYAKTIGSIADDYLNDIIFSHKQLAMFGTFLGPSIDLDPNMSVHTEINPNSISNIERAFVSVMDSAGTFLRGISLGGNQTGTYPVNIRYDPENNIYLLGRINTGDIIDIDPSVNVINLASNYVTPNFFVKYDNNFNPIWAKIFSTDDPISGLFLANFEINESYIGVCGNMGRGTLYEENDTMNNAISPYLSEYSMLIYALDKTDGSVYHLSSYIGLDDTIYACPLDICFDTNKNLYSVGFFDGPIDFNPSNTISDFDTSNTVYGRYSTNAFATRLNWSGFLGTNNYMEEFPCIIYPNPTTGMVYIQSSQNIDRVKILDVSGKVIMDKNNIGYESFQYNLSQLTKGMYLVEVTSHTKIIARKIIKE